MGDGKMVAVVAASSGAAMDRVRELQAQGTHAVTLCSPVSVESAVYQASTLGLRLQLEVREGAAGRGDWQEMQWALLAHGVTKTSEGEPLEPLRKQEACGGKDGLDLAERAVLVALASKLEEVHGRSSSRGGRTLYDVGILDTEALARLLRKAAAL